MSSMGAPLPRRTLECLLLSAVAFVNAQTSPPPSPSAPPAPPSAPPSAPGIPGWGWGLIIGIPVGLIVIGIIVYVVWMQMKKPRSVSSDYMPAMSSSSSGIFKNAPGTTEVDHHDLPLLGLPAKAPDTSMSCASP